MPVAHSPGTRVPRVPRQQLDRNSYGIGFQLGVPGYPGSRITYQKAVPGYPGTRDAYAFCRWLLGNSNGPRNANKRSASPGYQIPRYPGTRYPIPGLQSGREVLRVPLQGLHHHLVAADIPVPGTRVP
eukprot:1029885-Rhodomonas_salina.2